MFTPTVSPNSVALSLETPSGGRCFFLLGYVIFSREGPTQQKSSETVQRAMATVLREATWVTTEWTGVG